MNKKIVFILILILLIILIIKNYKTKVLKENFDNQSKDTYIKHSSNRNFCLTLAGNADRNNQPIILYNLWKNSNPGSAGYESQRWIYEKDSRGNYGYIKHASNPNYCITLSGNTHMNGQPIILYKVWNTAQYGRTTPEWQSQQWTIMGGKIVSGSNNNYCITLTYNADKNGQAIQLYNVWKNSKPDSARFKSQQWVFQSSKENIPNNCPFPKLKNQCNRMGKSESYCDWQKCCPLSFSNSYYGADSNRCGTGVLGNRTSEGWGIPKQSCENAGGIISQIKENPPWYVCTNKEKNYYQAGSGDCPGGDLDEGRHAKTKVSLGQCFDICDNLSNCKGVSYSERSKRCAPKGNICSNNKSPNGYIKYNRIKESECSTQKVYLMADGGGDARQGPSYFWSSSNDLNMVVTAPPNKYGYQHKNINNVFQRFRFKKCKKGQNPLGNPDSWYNTSASINDRILKHGDIVAIYNSQYGKVYDCAWVPKPCSLQPFPPPGGNWGSPYRIYSTSTKEGEPILENSTIYFDRMWQNKWNKNKSLSCSDSICKGVDMNQKSTFKFTKIYPSNNSDNINNIKPLNSDNQSAQKYTIYENKAIGGYDLKGGWKAYSSLENCKNDCKQSPSCKAFSFSKNGNGCALKNRVVRMGNNTNWDTYVLNTPDYTVYENKAIGGNDLKVGSWKAYSSLDNCKEDCKKNPNCKAFSFAKSGNGCALKNRVDNMGDSNLWNTYVLNSSLDKQLDKSLDTDCKTVKNYTLINDKWCSDCVSSPCDLSANTPEECSKKCDDYDNCDGFIYNPKNPVNRRCTPCKPGGAKPGPFQYYKKIKSETDRILNPGDYISLWNPQNERFVRMNSNGNVDSCCQHNDTLPNDWLWERLLVVDGGSGLGYSNLIALYNPENKRFIRMNSNGNVDSCCQIKVGDLPIYSKWPSERWVVVKAGKGWGKNDLIALWNPLNKRFLRMTSNGNVNSCCQKDLNDLPPVNEWPSERFFVTKINKLDSIQYYQIGDGDCQGNDLGGGKFFMKSMKLDDCKKYCNTLKGCTGITYNEKGGLCAPKSGKCESTSVVNGFKYYLKMGLKSLGCWKESIPRTLPETLGTNMSIPECSNAAKVKQYPVFAMQKGLCLSGPYAGTKYTKYGQSSECKDGLGSSNSINVYKTKGVSNNRININDSNKHGYLEDNNIINLYSSPVHISLFDLPESNKWTDINISIENYTSKNRLGYVKNYDIVESTDNLKYFGIYIGDNEKTNNIFDQKWQLITEDGTLKNIRIVTRDNFSLVYGKIGDSQLSSLYISKNDKSENSLWSLEKIDFQEICRITNSCKPFNKAQLPNIFWKIKHKKTSSYLDGGSINDPSYNIKYVESPFTLNKLFNKIYNVRGLKMTNSYNNAYPWIIIPEAPINQNKLKTINEAYYYCKNKGMRLCSANELYQWSQLGFSACDCSWTKSYNKNKYFIGKPSAIYNNCGYLGLNSCGMVEPSSPENTFKIKKNTICCPKNITSNDPCLESYNSNGPHSKECLKKTLLDNGCTKKGNLYIDLLNNKENSTINTWNKLSLKDIKKSIDNIKRKGKQGQIEEYKQCFNYKSPECNIKINGNCERNPQMSNKGYFSDKQYGGPMPTSFNSCKERRNSWVNSCNNKDISMMYVNSNGDTKYLEYTKPNNIFNNNKYYTIASKGNANLQLNAEESRNNENIKLNMKTNEISNNQVWKLLYNKQDNTYQILPKSNLNMMLNSEFNDNSLKLNDKNNSNSLNSNFIIEKYDQTSYYIKNKNNLYITAIDGAKLDSKIGLSNFKSGNDNQLWYIEEINFTKIKSVFCDELSKVASNFNGNTTNDSFIFNNNNFIIPSSIAPNMTKQFTIEFWAKISTIKKRGTIFVQGPFIAKKLLLIRTLLPSDIYMEFLAGSLRYSITPYLNKWSHYAFTYYPGGSKFFVNGNEIKCKKNWLKTCNDAIINGTNSKGNISIGNGPQKFGFDGELKKLKLFNTVRTQQQIQQSANNSNPNEPCPTDALLYIPMNSNDKNIYYKKKKN